MGGASSAAQGLAHRARWRWPELVFWVAAFGVLFLLDNLNIIYLRHVIFFWPLAFIASGLVALCSDGPRSGRVTAGMEILDAFEKEEVDGETPKRRLEILK